MTDTFSMLSDSRYRVQAPLDFSTASQIWSRGVQLLHAGTGELFFDLGGVPHTDSAGLALLIDWLAQAHRLGRTLRYTQCSTDLLALAKLSEVQELLEQGASAQADADLRRDTAAAQNVP